MSYKDGWAAMNLEMPRRVPRTEYSAERHWALIHAVTGLDVNEHSSKDVQEQAGIAFVKAWNYDCMWCTLINRREFGNCVTKMGHAEYAAGGTDRSDEIYCPYTSPEEVLRFDPWERLARRDKREIVRDFDAQYQANCKRWPDCVNMTGIYVTCISALIELFGWEMLILALSIDPKDVIKEKLTLPTGSESLINLASKSKNACIVVSDKTRPLPNKIILPVILDTLESAGIKKENIVFLVATGLHSPTNGKESIELFGKEIVENYRIVNHLACDEEANIFLGKTKSGTPVYINKIYYEADLKVLTGFIEPHFMTGFSGGRKSICPGIVSIKTIRAYHSPKFPESPFSAPGILERNPCHEEALEVARMVRADFIVNVTLDNEKRTTGIFAGDLEKAHLEGVKFCEGQACDYLEEPVDIVLTSAGGYPLDCNFYQTVTGLVGALDIVKAGGTIIIASSCIDGIGSLEFKKLLFGMKNINQFLEMINQDNYFTIDQWEVEELVKVLRKVRVRLYSTGLSNEDIINCHAHPIHSIEEGIEKAIAEYGKNARMAVIPNGPYVLPRLKERLT